MAGKLTSLTPPEGQAIISTRAHSRAKQANLPDSKERIPLHLLSAVRRGHHDAHCTSGTAELDVVVDRITALYGNIVGLNGPHKVATAAASAQINRCIGRIQKR